MTTKTTTQKIQDLKTTVDRINAYTPAITDPGTGVVYECFDFSKVVEIQSETDTTIVNHTTQIATHTTQLTNHQNLFNQTYVCTGSFATQLTVDSGVFTVDSTNNSTLLGNLISEAPITSWKFTNVPDSANVILKRTLMISNFVTTTLSDTAAVLLVGSTTPTTTTIRWIEGVKPSTVANEIFLIEFTIIKDSSKTTTIIGKTSRTGV